MLYPVDVNWSSIVRELLKHYKQTELSKKTGVHQGTISDMYRGIEKPQLSYKYGVSLMNAYFELETINQPEEA
ncbi:helix-turn-helix domain-containing protein [Psychrobacter sp. I-STPA6b]|uniref:helix-turn-helix domain-containing protein n=1 Tax=Psychrobacter sp. I-STPA6b TaxID=2585718 RepID=UPI001D0BF6CC|nr:helix-turn-helix transcriptional regulator [Psychrobacter sp. I-STPA6b]